MALLLAGIVGAALGLIAILSDGSSWYDKAFGPHTQGKPEFFLWIFLMTAQLALSAALVCPTLEIVRPLFRRATAQERKRVLVYAFVIATLVISFVLTTAFLLVPDLKIPIPALIFRILGLNLLSFSVVLVGGVGGWLIYVVLENEFMKTSHASLQDFMQLRRNLNVLLWFVGAILGASIIAMASLRNTVVTVTQQSRSFPWQYLFIYGAFFSTLLALTYVPMHIRAVAAERQLKDGLLPMPKPGDWTALAAWQAKRKALEDVMSQDLGGSSTPKAVAAILTPLSISLIGLLLRA